MDYVTDATIVGDENIDCGGTANYTITLAPTEGEYVVDGVYEVLRMASGGSDEAVYIAFNSVPNGVVYVAKWIKHSAVIEWQVETLYNTFGCPMLMGHKLNDGTLEFLVFGDYLINTSTRSMVTFTKPTSQYNPQFTLDGRLSVYDTPTYVLGTCLGDTNKGTTTIIPFFPDPNYESTDYHSVTSHSNPNIGNRVRFDKEIGDCSFVGQEKHLGDALLYGGYVLSPGAYVAKVFAYSHNVLRLTENTQYLNDDIYAVGQHKENPGFIYKLNYIDLDDKLKDRYINDGLTTEYEVIEDVDYFRIPLTLNVRDWTLASSKIFYTSADNPSKLNVIYFKNV